MISYVIRTDQPKETAEKLFHCLSHGEARIGWSSLDNLDLSKIVQANAAGKWNELDGNQQDAWYCHGFMDKAQIGDLLFYPNVPDYGKFAVAKITGEYRFLAANQAIEDDFRSVRSCELITPTPISKSDSIVSPLLRTRLGLQGRFYRLNADDDIEQLLKQLRKAGQATSDISATFDHMLADTAEKMGKSWSHYFPRKDLSNILAKLLQDNGYVVTYQEGPSENGADLVIQIENAFMKEPVLIGVQVGSYEDAVAKDQVSKKLKQLLSGWEINKLRYGALVLTGKCGPDAHAVIDQHNQANPEKENQSA